MKLIIGLGNPGKQYDNTRHNAGFMVLDKLRETWNFPEFKFDKKFNAEISKGIYEPRTANQELILAKPQTFMNLSGDAIKKIMDFYKIPIEDIVVIHDDLDIELGTYRIATDSSSAGHNGVQDIIDKLNTQKFKRIRIGIKNKTNTPGDLSAEASAKADVFVLQKFTNEELEAINKVIPEIINQL